MSNSESKRLSKELELKDAEYEKYRLDLARSLALRKIDTIHDLVAVYAELNCKNQKKSSLEVYFKQMSICCCIAFEQQEEHKLLEFKFVKLLRHCYIPEKFRKTYLHYNFIAEIKNESGIWTPGTYFAERKLECGVQNYFCCLLEVSDNGDCYGCQNKKADQLQHLTRGDYQRATPDHDWSFNDRYVISDSDDDTETSDDDLMEL